MFTYHPYQMADLRAIAAYLDSGERLINILYCTGGGKSPLALGIAGRFMANPVPEVRTRFTHSVILTPTDVIQEGFLFPPDSECLVRDPWGIYPMPLLKGTDTESLNRETGARMCISDASPTNLVTYLTGPNSSTVLVRSSHMAGRSLLDQYLEGHPDLGGTVWFFDEGHHARKGNQNLLLRSLILECGGTVFMCTATPDFRDTEAFPSNVPGVIRTLTDQMAEGFAPERLLSEVLHIEGAADNSEDYLVPANVHEAAVRTIDHIVAEADGGPPIKAIIRIQNQGDSEKNAELLLLIGRLAKDAGLRVYIGAPAHESNPDVKEFNREVSETVQRFNGKTSTNLPDVALFECRVKNYQDSCVDVVIGIQSVLEGFNWLLCSHMYMMGVPRELDLLIQGSGRTTRGRVVPGTSIAKCAGYPELWVNTSKVVLITAGNKEDVRKAQLEVVIRACAYLSTFRRWPLWSVLSKIFEKIPFGSDEEREKRRREFTGCQVGNAKAGRILLKLREALEWFGVSEFMSPRDQCKVLLAYMRDPSGGQGYYKSDATYENKDRDIVSVDLSIDGHLENFTEFEIRSFICMSMKDKRAQVEQALDAVSPEDLTAEVLQEIIDDVSADLSLGGKDTNRALQQMDNMVHCLCLTAESMNAIARRVEDAVSGSDAAASKVSGGTGGTGYGFIGEALRGYK